MLSKTPALTLFNVLRFRTLLSCIWIASKMFNDTPASNRVFAYLANMDTRQFTKLEGEILKRLDFNGLIEKEMYSSYQEQLDTFCNTQTEVLAKWYEDYKHDKRVLRSFKERVLELWTSPSFVDEGNNSFWSNYSDPHMQKMIKTKGKKEQPCVGLDSIEKFRFESYNSQAFKAHHSLRKRTSSSCPNSA